MLAATNKDDGIAAKVVLVGDSGVGKSTLLAQLRTKTIVKEFLEKNI